VKEVGLDYLLEKKLQSEDSDFNKEKQKIKQLEESIP